MDGILTLLKRVVLLVSISLLYFSSAWAMKENLLVVSNHSSVVSDPWAKQKCLQISEALDEEVSSQYQVHCHRKILVQHKGNSYVDPNEVTARELDQFVQTQKVQLNARYYIRLDRGLEGQVTLTLTDLKQADPYMANKMSWHFPDDQNLVSTMRKVLNRAFYVFSNMGAVRDALVEVALEKRQVPLSSDREENYTLFKSGGLSQADKDYLTAGSQLALALSFGYYGYHYLTTNTQDWDYSDFKETLKNKLSAGSMVRYDDNSWGVNRNHLYAGVSYYLICRGNGLTTYESMLCNLAASSAWEGLVEWREVFSINDQIFTGLSGSVLGESLFQMGRYLFAKGPSWLKNSLGLAWSQPKAFTDWYNKRFFNGQRGVSYDKDMAGRFEIEFGMMRFSDRKSEKIVGLNSEVIRIPLYEEPGKEAYFMGDIVESKMNLQLPMGQAFDQHKIFSKIVYAAYVQKNITVDERERLRGYSLYVGPSSAIEVNNNQNFKDDYYAIAHIIGSSIRVTSFVDGFKVTASMDVWGDAVMMHSLMIEKYVSEKGGQGLVANLRQAGYYHGFGTTSRGEVIVEFGGWAAGMSLSQSISKNTNARQRDMGQPLTHLDIADTINNATVFVDKKISKNILVRFSVSDYQRTGGIEGHGTGSAREVRRMISVVYYF